MLRNIKNIGRRNIECQLIYLLFSFSVGIAGMCTYQLNPVAVDKGGFLRYDIDLVNERGLLVCAILSIMAYLLINVVYKGAHQTNVATMKPYNENRVFWSTFIIYSFLLGILLALYFPGTGMNDTINCLMGFWQNTLQPAMFQMIIYGIFQGIFFMCKNATIAYAIIVILQIFAASYIVANYLRWIARKGIAKWLLILNMIYIMVMPLIGNYTIALLKDTWFTYAFFLLLPNIYDLIHGEKACWWQIVVAVFVVWFSRSNGKLVLVPIMVLLFIFCKSQRKHLAILLITLVVLNSGLDYAKNVRFGGYDESFRESMSVPLVQMAATVVWNGNMSEDEEEVLYAVLPEEKWRQNYAFAFVDPIKFDEHFDNLYLAAHKKEFLQTWASMLKKNLTIYVKAYLYHTYGNWSLAAYNTNAVDKTQSIFLQLNNNTGDTSIWGEYLASISLKNDSLLPNGLTKLLQEFHEDACEWNLWLTPGIMFLLLNLCTCIAWKNKRYKLMLTFLPLYLCWGCMMVASPASMIYRYSFYILLSLPFVLTMTWRDIGYK